MSAAFSDVKSQADEGFATFTCGIQGLQIADGYESMEGPLLDRPRSGVFPFCSHSTG